jgi:hypothetical protein
VATLNKYDRIRFQKLMRKLDELSKVLDEGDYWLSHTEEDQEEIDVTDWWGANDMDYDASDETDDQLRLLEVCRVCGRTLIQTCENCS